MTIRNLWDKFSFNDCQYLKNYIPYQYQIDIEIKDKQVQKWQNEMWHSYFEKQDVIDQVKKELGEFIKNENN